MAVPAIDTSLLIVGGGPAALVVAKVVSSAGLTSLVAGHEILGDAEPVVLDEHSVSILEPDGVLGVLRPYAAAQDPFAIAPVFFEQGLKHHCVADMLITVFDDMRLVDARPDGHGVNGVLTDGRRRWELHADAFLDGAELAEHPAELNAAIHRAAAYGSDVLARLT